MTLSTRLTVLLIAITTVVALLVGWFAIATSSRADYSSIDNTINAVIASGAGHPLTTLSSALSIVQENNYDVTMDVVIVLLDDAERTAERRQWMTRSARDHRVDGV